MKIEKYCLYVIVGLFLIVGCIGCSKKENKNDEKKENLVGGYNINDSVAGTLPENALRAFKNATKNDTKYVPLACMGTQIVAGTNYMILAKNEDKLVVLIVYEDLNQNATITNTYDFNLLDYLNNKYDVKKDSELYGGWNVDSEGSLNAMPQKLASAWSESFTNYKDIQLEPLASLGTQVVAGTNYAMLARGIVSGEEIPALYIVVIYDDLDYNASITSVSYVDLTKIINNN